MTAESILDRMNRNLAVLAFLEAKGVLTNEEKSELVILRMYTQADTAEAQTAGLIEKVRG